MSPLSWGGIILGALLSVAYLLTALKLKVTPELEATFHLFLSALGIMGAVRIVGFIAGGGFGKLLKADVNTGIFAVSEEDAVRPFQELVDKKPQDQPAEPK